MPRKVKPRKAKKAPASRTKPAGFVPFPAGTQFRYYPEVGSYAGRLVVIRSSGHFVWYYSEQTPRHEERKSFNEFGELISRGRLVLVDPQNPVDAEFDSMRIIK